MKENLLELNRNILKRKANGKAIFQPRINAWYDDRVFSKKDLPGKFAGCDKVALYEKIGCSDRLYNFNTCLEAQYDSSVKVEWISINTNGRDYEKIMTTPVGTVNEIVCGNDSNYGMMPTKWLCTTKEDLRVCSYIEEATTFSFNMDTYNKLYSELSHLGLPTMFIPRTNIQKLIVELSGVEDTYYLLADYEDEVEDYFKSLTKSQEGMIKAVAESPIEWINYGDNLHCRILPDYMFVKYILPEYEKRGDVLHKANKFVYSHWDGEVKGYLKYAKSCFLDGIEAITPEPQGDVTIEEVKEHLGDEIFLIDGLAAVLFNDTYSKEHLTRETKKILNLFEGQLILGISDEMPADGEIEKVELVTELVNEFNAKKNTF